MKQGKFFIIVIVATAFLWLGYTQLVGAYSDQVKYYGKQGLQYSQKGLYDQAIECYTKVIQLDPRCEAAYYNRAIAYGNKGMYNQAIADYNNAISLNSKDADAYYNAAIVYEKIGNYSSASYYYEHAANADPRLNNDQQFRARWDAAERENLRRVASAEGADVPYVMSIFKNVKEWHSSPLYSDLLRKKLGSGSGSQYGW